ncbi:MAG: hypothetical protein WAX14_08585 [Rhodococcus sp. (in: high G+C Gram-positive bacteria)]|uniref:hypothetical protein n=1 Tax=Rhodococcus sp. TaxID=1831 RepID=UPI003BB605D3
MPVDVGTAYQLWCGVLIFGVVSTITSAVVMWRERHAFVDQMLAQMPAMSEADTPTRDQMLMLLPFGLGIAAVGGLVILGLLYLVVRQILRGKNWARMLLTLLGVFMTLSTVPTLFGVGAGTGAESWVLGIVGILQSVLTVGAIVLMHRRESNLYFLRIPNN